MSAGKTEAAASAGSKVEEEFKLEPMAVPAIIAGYHFVIVAMPDGRIYINWYSDFECENNKNGVLLDLDANEVAQILCNSGITILKTDGRTVINFTYDYNEFDKKPLKKEIKYYRYDIKMLANTKKGPYSEVNHVLLQANGTLNLLPKGSFGDVKNIIPQTEDGYMIKPKSVYYFGELIAIIGEDNYCYIITNSDIFDNVYSVLLLHNKPIEVVKVANTTNDLYAMDFDGVVHRWYKGPNGFCYRETITGEDNECIKMRKLDAGGNMYMCMDINGNYHCNAKHSSTYRDIPKDKNGNYYKLIDADININSAAGITEEGEILAWGKKRGPRFMVNEEGEQLVVLTGSTIKSARKC